MNHVVLTDTIQEELYRDVASAAESGWDFSSRWLRESGELCTIRTTEVGLS
jgi:alpha,alpha-trehalase